MKKIYFVRHGATENNHKNVFQDENTELSEIGLGQARFLAERFQSIGIDKVLSSNMKRAVQTAEHISTLKKTGIESTFLFQEVLRPTEVRNKSKDDPFVKEIMKLVKENFNNPSYKYSDEENFFDLVERAKKSLDYIMGLNGENILVVTHGQYLTFFIGFLLFKDDFSAKEFKRMEHFFIAKNTGISIVEIDKDKPLLITWNDHAHLGELDIF